MIGTFNGINQVNSIFNRNGWIMNRKKKEKKAEKNFFEQYWSV